MQITNRTELEEAIERLKAQQEEQKKAIGIQFKQTYEGFLPGNLLRKALAKVTEPGDIRSTILKAVGGIGTGLLAKGIIGGIGGKAGSTVGKVIGNVVKVGASSAVFKNADKIKAYGTAIYNNLFKKKKDITPF